ncbi:flagellum site-determining protein YlxH [Clostridium acetireducens DSM 10703]|jgi:ATP-binding protein involved in chromosome partitioning|uniref:Iron-sulfur cluster carrier protein n=1 Tax=Clostridium acetireducens DSM 10703 TaxID=1121290 RepID=A0A1E8EXI4_9CLOT|nr:Mrp/NBP35 family ATP-binding protein [Clostridium acetireducens]OFI05485.1 flagellum site-determining protein YlxH [Clostridium acetireducens DSM 10703]
MSNCDNCPSKGNCNSDESTCSRIFPKYGKIKKIIGVISGKGGVGKSTVTGILAVQLKKAGYKVGVLDADITGPSMPRFFGINEKRADMIPISQEDIKFLPVETPLGIKVISLNLLTEEEEEPVIWRGPLITGVLTQMYTDTQWDDLDYLLIDMPPGTGDIALTIMQSLPVDGMVIVSTPQDMVSMIVKKVVIMAQKMDVNIVGVVENMSYVKCSKCGEKLRVFSKKSAEEQAKYLGIPLLAEMPINLDLVDSLEKGEAEKFANDYEDYKILLENFNNNIK